MKDFFNQLGSHDLPTGAAVLVGIVLLVLVFRMGKPINRPLIFFIAIALLAGAYWWHQHQ